MTTAEATGISNLMKEGRKFPPPAEFVAQRQLKSLDEYRRMHERSIKDPNGFWSEAAEGLHWFKKWNQVMDWKLPDAKWFVGGQTNASYNCLDLQIERGRGDHTAILFEGEPGDIRKISFNELRKEVCQAASALKNLGVKQGDRVTIYMPMIPELAVAMLACARIGAPHSIIFGGFTAQAIADRVEDAKSEFVITADGGWRRGKVVPLKAAVDEACQKTSLIKKVLVFQRIGKELDVAWDNKRDVWWHDAIAKADPQCPAVPLDAEHMLFLLYTSGSTGKPKGIHHTTAGYNLYTQLSAKYIFDLKPDDVYWCTADIGWITGHSYIVYGILSNGITTLMYEGAPNHPDWDRFWDIIERHKVTKFYTAPTALRAFMRQGDEHPNKHDLSTLKMLGTVGEPINPEAWMWYHRTIGKERCPIVDTWWQTETGGVMITPLPGVTPTKPGSATLPFFGIDPAIMDKDGKEQPANVGGFLTIKKPWPGMLRGIYGDRDRYMKQYWSEIQGVYFAGDSARCDEDGYYWIMGRIDDVIKVSGHRLGSAEIESALVSYHKVAEAAVVAIPDDLTGQAIAAFVTLKKGHEPSEAIKKEVINHVATTVGKLAKPAQLRFTEALPKTRSGKIMRRLLVEIATSGEVKGDTTTLEDFGVLTKLAEKEE